MIYYHILLNLVKWDLGTNICKFDEISVKEFEWTLKLYFVVLILRNECLLSIIMDDIFIMIYK